MKSKDITFEIELKDWYEIRFDICFII
jgi:hypothetical protein